MKAGPYNGRAVEILSTALRNWPAEVSENWGPAARDYLSLQLAFWYLQRGEVEKGLAVFRLVRDHPTAPDNPYPAEIARIYLGELEHSGYYRAGLEVVGYLERESENIGNDRYYLDNSLSSLELALAADPPQSQVEFTGWLERNKVRYQNLVQTDLDGDGLEDWLAYLIVDFSTYKEYRLIMFLRQEGKVRPRLLSYFKLMDGEDVPALEWQAYRPLPGADLVTVIRSGENLWAVRVVKSAGEYRLITDVNNLGGSYYGWINTLWSVSDWEFINSIKGKVLVVRSENATGVYAWNAEEGRLKPTGYSPELQEDNIALAEQALFGEDNPRKANQILETLLSVKNF